MRDCWLSKLSSWVEPAALLARVWFIFLVAVFASRTGPERVVPDVLSGQLLADVLDEVPAEPLWVDLGLRRPVDAVVVSNQPGMGFDALAADGSALELGAGDEVGALLDQVAGFVLSPLLALVGDVGVGVLLVDQLLEGRCRPDLTRVRSLDDVVVALHLRRVALVRDPLKF